MVYNSYQLLWFFFPLLWGFKETYILKLKDFFFLFSW